MLSFFKVQQVTIQWIETYVLTMINFQYLPLGELSKQIFGKSWEFGPRRGGGGLTQSQLFFKIDQNLICLGNAHKCWDIVAIWRGFPSPNQKFTKNDIKDHIKITNHPKNVTFS